MPLLEPIAFKEAYVRALLRDAGDEPEDLLDALSKTRPALSSHQVELLRARSDHLVAEPIPVEGYAINPLFECFLIEWKRFSRKGVGPHHPPRPTTSPRRPSLVQVLPYDVPEANRKDMEWLLTFEHECWLEWWKVYACKPTGTDHQVSEIAPEIVPIESSVVFGELEVEVEGQGLRRRYFLQRPALEWPTIRAGAYDFRKQAVLWHRLSEVVHRVFSKWNEDMVQELQTVRAAGAEEASRYSQNASKSPIPGAFLDRILTDGRNVVCTAWRDWSQFTRRSTGVADAALFPKE